MSAEKQPKVIKRYANRKLYDTERSCYVTLDEIAQMIKEGDDVQVVDNKSKDDLTAVTLAQIIVEEEKKVSRMPLKLLRSIIQSGNEAIGDFYQKRVMDPVASFKDDVERRVESLFVTLSDFATPIIFANDAFLSLTGYERDDVLGHSFNFLMARGADARALALVAAYQGTAQAAAEAVARHPQLCALGGHGAVVAPVAVGLAHRVGMSVGIALGLLAIVLGLVARALTGSVVLFLVLTAVNAFYGVSDFALDIVNRSMPLFVRMHEMTPEHAHEEIQLRSAHGVSCPGRWNRRTG